MKENWVICHDNGVPGQRGASDGYASEAQAAQAAADMAAHRHADNGVAQQQTKKRTTQQVRRWAGQVEHQPKMFCG